MLRIISNLNFLLHCSSTRKLVTKNMPYSLSEERSRNDCLLSSGPKKMPALVSLGLHEDGGAYLKCEAFHY